MKEKLIKSALIALGGVLISVIPLLVAGFNAYLADGTAIDWKTPLAMLTTGIGTWLINLIKLLIIQNGSNPESGG